MGSKLYAEELRQGGFGKPLGLSLAAQQKNTRDCGVLIIKFAVNLAKLGRVTDEMIALSAQNSDKVRREIITTFGNKVRTWLQKQQQSNTTDEFAPSSSLYSAMLTIDLRPTISTTTKPTSPAHHLSPLQVGEKAKGKAKEEYNANIDASPAHHLSPLQVRKKAKGKAKEEDGIDLDAINDWGPVKVEKESYGEMSFKPLSEEEGEEYGLLSAGEEDEDDEPGPSSKKRKVRVGGKGGGKRIGNRRYRPGLNAREMGRDAYLQCVYPWDYIKNLASTLSQVPLDQWTIPPWLTGFEIRGETKLQYHIITPASTCACGPMFPDNAALIRHMNERHGKSTSRFTTSKPISRVIVIRRISGSDGKEDNKKWIAELAGPGKLWDCQDYHAAYRLVKAIGADPSSVETYAIRLKPCASKVLPWVPLLGDDPEYTDMPHQVRDARYGRDATFVLDRLVREGVHQGGEPLVVFQGGDCISHEGRVRQWAKTRPCHKIAIWTREAFAEVPYDVCHPSSPDRNGWYIFDSSEFAHDDDTATSVKVKCFRKSWGIVQGNKDKVWAGREGHIYRNRGVGLLVDEEMV